MKKNGTRREFLALGGRAAGASLLAAHLPLILAAGRAAADAAAAVTPHQHIGEGDARVLAAVADQVFPPDEQPGASDLGAVYFMDQALGGFMAGSLPMIREGCAELDRAAQASAAVGFAELSFDAQTGLLEDRTSTAFFGTVHFLTLAGVFAAPGYGGNRDHLGWRMLGFESRHVWQPPFGHYDAAYEEARSHAGN